MAVAAAAPLVLITEVVKPPLPPVGDGVHVQALRPRRSARDWTATGEPPGPEATKWKLATDDCRRVFTTSRGQVAIAPAVPPRLRKEHSSSQHDAGCRKKYARWPEAPTSFILNALAAVHHLATFIEHSQHYGEPGNIIFEPLSL